MPNSKSAKKRLRQNISRKARNLTVKRAVRHQIRKVREAVESGDAELAETELRLAVKKLDKAGAHNLIHQNTAARLKSRLSARVKAVKAPAG